MIRPTAALALLALLAACEPAPMPKAEAAPLPPELCKQVGEGLDKLSANGRVEFRPNGEGTVEEAAWVALPSDSRDQVARMLAYHAVCTRGGGATDQEVTIRSETGMVLMRRTIDTRLDLGDVLGDEGP